ncbi:MAG: hypothetical protein RL459_2229 [Pseudomonadota bacterium]|jgi:hypothetical protein
MNQSAPSVSYPVGRSRFYPTVLCALWLFSVVIAVTWFLQSGRLVWAQGAMAGLLILLGVLFWREGRHQTKASLQWNGQEWVWIGEGEEPISQVSVTFDFQNVMLLTVDSQSGRRRWVWVQGTVSPRLWLPLRRALTAHGRPLTAPGPKGS